MTPEDILEMAKVLSSTRSHTAASLLADWTFRREVKPNRCGFCDEAEGKVGKFRLPENRGESLFFSHLLGHLRSPRLLPEEWREFQHIGGCPEMKRILGASYENWTSNLLPLPYQELKAMLKEKNKLGRFLHLYPAWLDNYCSQVEKLTRKIEQEIDVGESDAESELGSDEDALSHPGVQDSPLSQFRSPQVPPRQELSSLTRLFGPSPRRCPS